MLSFPASPRKINRKIANSFSSIFIYRLNVDKSIMKKTFIKYYSNKCINKEGIEIVDGDNVK